MQTKIVVTAVTELTEDEARGVLRVLECMTHDDIVREAPTAVQMDTARLFATQLGEALG